MATSEVAAERRGGAASGNDACVAWPRLAGQTGSCGWIISGAWVCECVSLSAAATRDKLSPPKWVTAATTHTHSLFYFCQVSSLTQTQTHTPSQVCVCCSAQSLAGHGVSLFAARGETPLRRYCGRSAKVCFRLWKGAPGPWRGPGSAPGVQFVYNTSLAVWRRLSPQQHQWVSNANWSPGTFTNGSK